MTENQPVVVFVSYSHDSPEHKRWVSSFATVLRSRGIDALIDQWETEPGDDLALFMERGVSESDRVIIVCTDEYVRKADAGKGGVGYERMIVTSELVKNIGTKKFIPVIRQGEGEQVMPLFLGGARKYVDFRNDAEFNEKMEELIVTLNKEAGLAKPPLGKAAPALTAPSPQITTLPDAIEDVEQVYSTALSLARADDMLGWRKLVQKLKASFKPGLLAWRRKYEAALPKDYPSMRNAVDEAVEYVAPAMAMAFAGIESEKDRFKDQRALLDEFFHITEWSRAGTNVLIELPTALGFIYQALHGAVCMHTGQPELAKNFAIMRVGHGYDKKIPLWRHHGLIGWPETLGQGCNDSWKYLSGAYKKWPWLHEIFGGEEEFKISLISYYIMLNFMEFGQTIKEYPSLFTKNDNVSLDVPICFATEEYHLGERALSQISKFPDILESILRDWGVTKDQAVPLWPQWIVGCKGWLRSARYWIDRVPHEKFMEYLGWKD